MKNNDKKIKICILTSVHPVFDTRIFHKQAKTLVGAGYNVVLVAQHNKNDIVDGVNIIALPKPKNRFYRILFLTRRAYKIALKEKADIYHFHDPELLPWMVLLKKRTGAKIIYDVHEDIPKQILSKHWIPKFLRKFVAFVFNLYEKKIIKKMDFIITVGDDVKERFKKINFNVDTIKNFPILEYFNNFQKKEEKNVFKIIYIGSITEIRGINQIVTAMKYMPENVKLMLMGRFSSENLENQVRKLKGFNKVEYFGQLSLKKVYSYLFKANLGIICFLPEPNHINSNPNKFFEYMAAGLPIIASNFPLWKEIIQGNKCGICVNPLEPKEIAKAIEYLIEHPKEAKQMGENGRKAVLEKYNWENESKKLLDTYKKLLKD